MANSLSRTEVAMLGIVAARWVVAGDCRPDLLSRILQNLTGINRSPLAHQPARWIAAQTFSKRACR
jgi:hypothetical protein